MKIIILHICLLAISLSAWSQKASIQLTVEPEEIAVNQQFSITIKSNVEGNIIENWPSNFVKGYGVQSLSRYVQDINNGKMIQEHIVVFTGSFSKTGNYKIGPFYVKAGNKTYTSSSATVNVVNNPTQNKNDEISRRQLSQPAFGVVEVSSTKIYEGEPLIISGRVYSREQTFGRPILKRPFTVNGISDVHPIQQTEMWETKTIRNREYESFSFEKKVLFPVGNGVLSITPFEIYLPYFDQDYAIVSSVPTVEIIPLPANPPAEFIGAVGEFSVEQNYTAPKTVKQGDIIQIAVEITGKGNIHAIESPSLRLPKGMSTYGDVEVKEDYTFNSSGASGKVTYTYHVQALKEGQQTIQPIKISYFNPKKEKYETVEATNPIIVSVKENQAFALQNELENDQKTEDLTEGKSTSQHTSKNTLLDSTHWVWYGAGGILLLCALLFVFIKRKNDKREELERSNRNASIIDKPISLSDVKEMLNKLEIYHKEEHFDSFYSIYEKALLSILRYKLNKPTNSTLMRSELIHELKEKDGATAEIIQQLLEKCDYSRYGMGVNQEEQEFLLSELKKLV